VSLWVCPKCAWSGKTPNQAWLKVPPYQTCPFCLSEVQPESSCLAPSELLVHDASVWTQVGSGCKRTKCGRSTYNWVPTGDGDLIFRGVDHSGSPFLFTHHNTHLQVTCPACKGDLDIPEKRDPSSGGNTD